MPARAPHVTEKGYISIQNSCNTKIGGIAIDITHRQERTPCCFRKINRAMVTSLIEAGELFWGRETARWGVQSCLGTDFCELIYAVDEG
jgi:hypothetical protein